MDYIKRFKSLPISTKRQLSLGMILALLVGLPLFVYAILTGRFLFQNKAASGEVTPTPTATATPLPPGSHCAPCGGIANIKCKAGYSCYTGRVTHPDQMGICIDQRGPAYCPSPTCQPRPACLDSKPACAIPEPYGGYCPVTTPRPGGECQSCGGFTGAICQAGLICKQIGIGIPERPGTCVKRDGSSKCPIVSPTPKPEACNEACGGNTAPNCQTGLTCFNAQFEKTVDQITGISIGAPGVCRNPKCLASADCKCPTPTPVAKCIRKAPSINLTPDNQTGNPGQKLVYTISVTNNDTACAKETFTLSLTALLTKWIGQLSNTKLTLDSQGTGTAQVSVTSPQSPKPSPKAYSVKVNVTGVSGSASDTSNYTVSLTPPPSVRPFVINLKLEGVTDDAASYAKLGDNRAKVVVKFLSQSLGASGGFVTTPVPVDYAGNGIYQLHFGVWSTDLPAANDYSLTLKSEKSIATRFCQVTGQTKHCSGAGTISVPQTPTQTVDLDFTGIPLQPGDLAPQDGVVTTLGADSDLAKLLALMAKPNSSLTTQDLLVGDLNYDGFVDIRDLYLFRLTLQTRYDE